MAKRRVKKRTHVGADDRTKNGAVSRQQETPAHASAKDPRSMVIRIGAGDVGLSVSQLAADVRHVMEPSTAARLKERRANRLRDYVAMAGPLGVTHLMLFSRSAAGNTNLRMALAPRGPTLHFAVEQYSLCKDIRRSQKHPLGGGKEFLNPPLLVMNNFTSPDNSASKVPRHLETLATTVFQSLFPPINPQTTLLKTMKRVLLLNREPNSESEDGSFVLNFRHYAILTKSVGLSRPLRRLNKAEKLVAPKQGRKGGLPNLGKLTDIADFMIGGENGEGYMTDATSGSEVDTDAEVEVVEEAPRKAYKSRKGREEDEEEGDGGEERVEKRAVKLVELGPRMKLRLTKVEDGLCSGKILWHEYIHKTNEEVRELEQRWEKRRHEKARRKREQKENMAKKQAEKAKSAKGGDDAAHDELDEFEDFSGSDIDMDDYDGDDNGALEDEDDDMGVEKPARGSQ